MSIKIWEIKNEEDLISVYNGADNSWLFRKSDVDVRNDQDQVFLSNSDIEITISYFNVKDPDVDSGEELYNIIKGWIQDWWDAQDVTDKEILEELKDPEKLATQGKQDEGIQELKKIVELIITDDNRSQTDLLQTIATINKAIYKEQVLTNNLLKIILS